jgi:hypothetical protein
MVLHNMLRGCWQSQRPAHPTIANRYLRETCGGPQPRSRVVTVELRSVSSATPSALAKST